MFKEVNNTVFLIFSLTWFKTFYNTFHKFYQHWPRVKLTKFYYFREIRFSFIFWGHNHLIYEKCLISVYIIIH